MKFRLCINVLIWSILSFFSTSCQKPTGWAVYYGDSAPPKAFKSYGLVIVDRLYPFDIKELKDNGTQVIAYVSLGEVTVNDPWYQKARDAGLLLRENTSWAGSFAVDIRNPAWEQLLFSDVLPPLVARGFDGLMLDTLDSPLIMDSQKPGMQQAAVHLVQQIREAYPKLVLIQNRGYAALEQTAPMLNYVLAESTFTNYDPAEKKHILRDAAGQDYALGYLRKAKAAAPGLRILGLEYWEPEDTKMKVQLSQKMCKNNMLPFVSTRSLNQIHP